MEKSPKVGVITIIVLVIILSAGAGYYVLANANKISILDNGYFFGAAPGNSSRTIVYIYLKFSGPLRQGDVIHIYKNESEMHYNMVTWRVNRTQDGKTNITIPVDMLENLNGTMDIYVKRVDAYLYRGEISFSVHPEFDISVKEVQVHPVSIKYAYITRVLLTINSRSSIYIAGLDLTVFNMTYREWVPGVIKGATEINMTIGTSGKVAQLVQNGTLPMKITVLYPTYPYHDIKPERYSVDTKCVINFDYSPVTITGISVESSFWTTVVSLQLSGVPEGNFRAVIYQNGTVVGEGRNFGRDNNNTVFTDVYLPPGFNFNGTYLAVLEDDYGFTLDSFAFTLRSGPLRLISHEEELNETGPSTVLLRAIHLRLENMGNFEIYMMHYAYTISFASNGTVVASDDHLGLYQEIPPGEAENVTISFTRTNVSLIKGNTYKVSLVFVGGNVDVKRIVEYTFTV